MRNSRREVVIKFGLYSPNCSQSGKLSDNISEWTACFINGVLYVASRDQNINEKETCLIGKLIKD